MAEPTENSPPLATVSVNVLPLLLVPPPLSQPVVPLGIAAPVYSTWVPVPLSAVSIPV